MTLEAARQKLQEMQFEIFPAGDGRILARKHGCAAGLEERDGVLAFFARPGRVVGGELARLIDRGYQKFLKTSSAEVPALLDDLRHLNQFQRELRFAVHAPQLFNESLGTVSDRYIYDRVWFRDEGRQPKAWEQPSLQS